MVTGRTQLERSSGHRPRNDEIIGSRHARPRHLGTQGRVSRSQGDLGYRPGRSLPPCTRFSRRPGSRHDQRRPPLPSLAAAVPRYRLAPRRSSAGPAVHVRARIRDQGHPPERHGATGSGSGPDHSGGAPHDPLPGPAQLPVRRGPDPHRPEHDPVGAPGTRRGPAGPGGLDAVGGLSLVDRRGSWWPANRNGVAAHRSARSGPPLCLALLPRVAVPEGRDGLADRCQPVRRRLPRSGDAADSW